MHRHPMFADEFRRAVAIAIADARSSFAQKDVAECDARAGHGQFTNGLHGTPLPRAGLDVPTVPGMTVCRARGALRFTVAQLNFRREGLRDILHAESFKILRRNPPPERRKGEELLGRPRHSVRFSEALLRRRRATIWRNTPRGSCLRQGACRSRMSCALPLIARQRWHS